MKVAIVHSAVPPEAPADEQDVFVQVAAVRAALEAGGHRVASQPFPLDLEALRAWLRSTAPDAVFNLVETVGGAGRLIHLAPALFDFLRLPYTGAPTAGMFLTSNKLLAKQFLRARGLPTPDWYTAADLATDGPLPPGRYIVKSVWEHASVGLDDAAVVTAADRATLRAALDANRARQGGECFAEAFIDGREFNLALLADARPDAEPQVLPPAEILFPDFAPDQPRIVGYAAKWLPDSFAFTHTPRRFAFPDADRAILAQLGSLARECWNAFGLMGYARVDFRVHATYGPHILEINSNPCLSPDAGFAAALEQAQIPMVAAVQRILSAAVWSAGQPLTAAEFGDQYGNGDYPRAGVPPGRPAGGP